MNATILQGNCIETLKTLPAGSVQTCVTSPPYWGLRDYGTAKWEGGDPACDHLRPRLGGNGDKSPINGKGSARDESVGLQQYKGTCSKCGAVRVDEQIGMEETPEEFVNHLVLVFREVWRVLKDDGTLWLNLGDSYAGSGGAGGWSKDRNGAVENANKKVAGLKSKDLVGIPWMVAFALRADGWYLRSDIIWNKPNPMPESVTDRPTKSHEYIFLLSKSGKYFYDAEAVREPVSEKTIERWGGLPERKNASLQGLRAGSVVGESVMGVNKNGRNKRTVWTVTPKPYRGAHFATFPPDLIEPCILAGTSEKGECPECGKAWVRSVEKTPPGRHESENQTVGSGRGAGGDQSKHAAPSVVRFVGWEPQCSCGADPVPQTVLDPFNGSGTTGAVSLKHGRGYIGCELNPEYIKLSHDRFSRVQYIAPLFGVANA
jgi:DNA modification methylase